MSDQTTSELLQGYGFLRLFPRFPQELFSETYPQGIVVAGSEDYPKYTLRHPKTNNVKQGEINNPSTPTLNKPKTSS